MPTITGPAPPFVGLAGRLRYEIEVLRAQNWPVDALGTLQVEAQAQAQTTDVDSPESTERSEVDDGADH